MDNESMQMGDEVKDNTRNGHMKGNKIMLPPIRGRVSPGDANGIEMEKSGPINDYKNGKASTSRNGDTDSKSSEDKKKEDTPTVGTFEVFKFASKRDILFMILGTLCAAGHGASLPGMIIVFGEMINLFVDAGIFQATVTYLVDLGILANLNLTEAAVIKDPSLLAPYYNEIWTMSNFTVNNETMTNAVSKDLLDVMREYAIYFVAIGGGVIVLGYGQVMFWMIASERQTHRIRKSFYANVLRQDIGWFDTHESGELNSRLTSDISKIHDGIGDKMGSFTQWMSSFLTGFIVGFYYGWKLTLVILSISPLLAGGAFLMTKLVALASGQELKAYARAGAIAEEVIGAIRTVIAFGGQKKECERYNENLVEARDLGVKKGLVNGLSMGVVWLVIFGAYALGFWYGAKLSRDEPDNYTIGSAMIVFFAVLIGAFSLGSAAPSMQSFAEALGAAYSVYEIIAMEPPIDSYSDEGEKPAQLNGNIQLRNVNFKYPSRPDVQVLNGVTLNVNRGQTVALVGSSGCGKSTVVQLIQRFYDPEAGQVMIDGKDVKNLNVKWLRQHMGIVSQEPVLFGTTIAENIRYGRDGVTKEEIEAAAMMANAHNFIMDLPEKYETLCGERGAQLSGGQKQRVAIARALVRDPKILLLDEATSALDTESEGIVQDALEKASHGRTTIVIAHRLSTIKTADKIAGFASGSIVEEGTHDDLMKKGGIYNKLVTQQTAATEDDREIEMYDAPKKTPLKSVKSVEGKALKRALSTEEEKAKEEEEKEKKVDASLGRILKMNSDQWPMIVLGCVGSLINGGLMPAFAIIFAEIIGVFAEQDADKQAEKVLMYCMLFLGLGFLSLVTYFLQGYMFGRSGEYLTLKLRSLAFKATLRQEIAYFDDPENSVGALTTRLATDASQVQGAAGIKLGMALMGLCSVLAGIIIAFYYSWKMTLVILGFVPLLFIGGALQMQMLTGAAGKNKEALEAAGKVAIESIENIRTVASLSLEQKFIEKFEGELAGPYRAALLKAHLVAITFSFSQGVIFFCYAASFYFGAYLISENELEFVEVFKVFSAIVFGAMAIGQSSSFAPDAAKAQTSAEQIFALLDRVPEIDTENTDGEKLSKYNSTIVFKDVKFRYPTRKDVQVLQGLNLDVPQGQTVALVGSSGCGKSTTVQLTERFYLHEDGDVLLDNHRVEDLNLQWLRSQIGIVSQEPILFDRSIAENIAYGDNDRDIPMDEIISAARGANIHNFITSLPDGYNTNVGEKGAQLSGGQKQRVAIARALVRNPKILLLDEATSALDTESEKIVQEALDKAREGRTCIVIAHRLSTIQSADKICVIRHGIVTEEGTHNDLLKRQGFYYKLHQAQARKK